MYNGPFKILDRIGKVAYTLDLPSSTSIHPTFHVSQLKKHFPSNKQPQPLVPPPSSSPIPIAILDRRIVKRKNTAAT